MIAIPDTQAIDAVITWVNGASDDHQRSRLEHMVAAQKPLHENAVNPHRWACNDEILYCLQSIENHAPWVRQIWIVVGDDLPDLAGLPQALRDRIRIVYHRDIFHGFEHALPTFNSLAIESLIWRIKGLSERFLYFNDDVFLAAPLQPEDVFEGVAPVLRGKWVDYSDLPGNPEMQSDPAKFNHFMQINAAGLVGFEPEHLFCAAHVVHPLRRSVLAHLFDRNPKAFANNVEHRFRDLSQFLPQGFHNHACIADQTAVLHGQNDHLHIKSGQGSGQAATQTRTLLQDAADGPIKFLCINDLPQLEALVPDARVLLARAIGGFTGPDAARANQAVQG